MRIGTKPHYENEQALWEWVNSSGNGVIGLSYKEELPTEMLQYVASSLGAWGMPYDKRMDEVVSMGAWASYWHLDISDPYAWFFQVSCVNYSDNWNKYAYEIYDSYSKTHYEADPEKLETFSVADPSQQQEVYADMIEDARRFHERSLAGEVGPREDILHTLPNSSGYEIEGLLDDGCLFESGPINSICDNEVRAQIEAFLAEHFGGATDDLTYDYLHKAAWAAFVWLVGPPGQQWRVDNHDIFYLAHRQLNREVIMYDMSCIEQENYRRLPRAPKACVACGLDSWCVEMTQISGTTRYMCESCLNGKEVLFEQAHCGTKICRYVNCPNHPEHGQEGAMLGTLRNHGQLMARTQQGNLLAQSGENRVRLLKN